mgnify:CR=1 FL=1|jgi:hypothetical protein
MTIEVKQLIIKSTVSDEGPAQQDSEQRAVDMEQLKEALMQECREMIADSLNEVRER